MSPTSVKVTKDVEKVMHDTKYTPSKIQKYYKDFT
jgi:hypothetical protein